MDCDRVVFQGESPPIPQAAPIVSFSQRHSGQQTLPTQVCSLYINFYNKIKSISMFIVYLYKNNLRTTLINKKKPDLV